MKDENMDMLRINLALSLKIRYCREICNLSQEQLSKLMNTKRSNIAYYESGKVCPNAAFLLKFSVLFDVSLDTLINYEFDIAQFMDIYGNRIYPHNDELKEFLEH